MRHARILAAIALAAVVASPALAQKAKTSAAGAPRIIVTEANLPQAYTALGAVTANVHPKSMNPKTPTHDLLDAELRRQAAALGADAVVQVRYMIRNPMMSDKGSDAMGVAVRFTSVAATAAAAPASPSPAPSQLAAVQPATAASPSVQTSAPQVAAATPTPQPAVKPAPAPALAPSVSAPAAPAASAVASAAPAAAAPAPAPAAETRHATSADMIVVTDADFAGRRYIRVGDVRSEVHPKSMFPKTTSHDLLNTDLKAQALKLGADAVILVKYDMHNALTSTKGDIATGVAVRFD